MDTAAQLMSPELTDSTIKWTRLNPLEVSEVHYVFSKSPILQTVAAFYHSELFVQVKIEGKYNIAGENEEIKGYVLDTLRDQWIDACSKQNDILAEWIKFGIAIIKYKPFNAQEDQTDFVRKAVLFERMNQLAKTTIEDAALEDAERTRKKADGSKVKEPWQEPVDLEMPKMAGIVKPQTKKPGRDYKLEYARRKQLKSASRYDIEVIPVSEVDLYYYKRPDGKYEFLIFKRPIPGSLEAVSAPVALKDVEVFFEPGALTQSGSVQSKVKVVLPDLIRYHKLMAYAEAAVAGMAFPSTAEIAQLPGISVSSGMLEQFSMGAYNSFESWRKIVTQHNKDAEAHKNETEKRNERRQLDIAKHSDPLMQNICKVDPILNLYPINQNQVLPSLLARPSTRVAIGHTVVPIPSPVLPANILDHANHYLQLLLTTFNLSVAFYYNEMSGKSPEEARKTQGSNIERFSNKYRGLLKKTFTTLFENIFAFDMFYALTEFVKKLEERQGFELEPEERTLLQEEMSAEIILANTQPSEMNAEEIDHLYDRAIISRETYHAIILGHYKLDQSLSVLEQNPLQEEEEAEEEEEALEMATAGASTTQVKPNPKRQPKATGPAAKKQKTK